MAKYKFPDRDPLDISDATFNFIDFLTNHDTGEVGVIEAATVTVVDGGSDLIVDGNLVGEAAVTSMLSGWIVGKTYTLSCSITLTDGRRFNRSARVSVKDH